ncbi:hypothetical protein [Microbulbifer variabilis]|uniref:hypothetical protein n=1 Tax=Microbulbifer variabilis TaxID=266805 RepID=UPI001CFD6AB6|nr:hypothetical protein [Microbulbifer variabilis]
MRNVGMNLTRIQVATTIADVLLEDYRVNNWRNLNGFPEIVVEDKDAYFLVSLKLGEYSSRELMLDRGSIRAQAGMREDTGRSTPQFVSAIQDLVVELERALEKIEEKAVD